MKNSFKSLKNAFFKNWRGLLIFVITCRISVMFLFSRLISLFVNIGLRFQPYAFLTLQNIFSFLIRPPVPILVLLVIFLFLLYIYFENSIITCGLQSGVLGHSLTMAQMIVGGVKRAKEIFHLRNLTSTLPHLTFSFISNLYFLWALCFNVNPYSTFMPGLFKNRIFQIILPCVILFCAVFTAMHGFAFYFMLNEEKSIGKSSKHCRKLFFRHPWYLLFGFLCITLFTCALWYALRYLVSFLVALVSVWLFPKATRVALVLTINQYVIIAAMLLCSTIGYLLHTTLVAWYYCRYSNAKRNGALSVFDDLIPRRRQLKFLTPAITAALAGLCVLALVLLFTGTARAEHNLGSIQIAAHRGFSSKAPENTVAAIELAADYLSDYAEIDVQCTVDGEIVLFHDLNLKRLTGTKEKLDSLSLTDLLEFDIGAWFSEAFAGTKINTLDEALEAAKGRICLIIELKKNSTDYDLPQKVLDLIHEHHMEDQVIIQSTYYPYLKEIHELEPDIKTGIILYSGVGKFYSDDEAVDFYCVRSAFLTRSNVRAIHELGKQVFAWTVNTQTEMERLKRIHVDCIITDVPILVREVLYRQTESDLLEYIAEQLAQVVDSEELETEEWETEEDHQNHEHITDFEITWPDPVIENETVPEKESPLYPALLD